MLSYLKCLLRVYHKSVYAISGKINILWYDDQNQIIRSRMETKDLNLFVSLRVETIRQLFDMATDIDNRPSTDRALYRRLMVFSGSLANEITPHQSLVKELFDKSNNNSEIPHIMNSTLSSFKSYSDGAVIKPVWKAWKTTTKEA